MVYLGAHCNFDRISQFLNTPQHQGPGLDAKLDVLGSIVSAPGQPAPHLISIASHAKQSCAQVSYKTKSESNGKAPKRRTFQQVNVSDR